jgi:hypothetical protein
MRTFTGGESCALIAKPSLELLGLLALCSCAFCLPAPNLERVDTHQRSVVKPLAAPNKIHNTWLKTNEDDLPRRRRMVQMSSSTVLSASSTVRSACQVFWLAG